MNFFVREDSIVRKIWGKSETIIFIFAGASAEFALNKAVDWLFFTGKLPAAPLARLFSTVDYAQKIVFAEQEVAAQLIGQINKIHGQVASERRAAIPDWAYRDVLYMLIDYSIRSYELLERSLTEEEKTEIFEVFYRMGMGMALKDLPDTYESWTYDRIRHMQQDLYFSTYTRALFEQYEKHLGKIRYKMLIEAQKLVVPSRVRDLFKWNSILVLKPAVHIYKMIGHPKIQNFLKSLVLPSAYVSQIKKMDVY